MCDEGKWLQNRGQSTKTNDTFKSKDSLSDFFRNLGEYDSLDSVNIKVSWDDRRAHRVVERTNAKCTRELDRVVVNCFHIHVYRALEL